MSEKNRSQWKEWLILLVLLMVAALIGLLFPAYQAPMLQASWSLGKEMLFILPAVMVLMGLFSVWISQEMVVQYLGRTSGIRGITLALLFGATPTGPLYVAFPIATALRKKGARLSNIIIFLTAWACIKLPQEMVELQFLGARFMLARLSLTILAAIIMGFIMEQLINSKEQSHKNQQEQTSENI